MKSSNRKLGLLEEMRTVSCGNISDAMDFLGLPNGVVRGGPKMLSATMSTLAGYAFTVTQMPKHQTATKGATKHRDVFNRLAQPGDVVVIDTGEYNGAASCGLLLALRAKMRGIAGIIINGCCRDAKEIVEQGIPFFCSGSVPRKSILLETVDLNRPVVIGGVQIRRGDLIIGDVDGLIIVPIQHAEEILKQAKRIHMVEEKMEALILSGEDFDGLRERCQ